MQNDMKCVAPEWCHHIGAGTDDFISSYWQYHSSYAKFYDFLVIYLNYPTLTCSAASTTIAHALAPFLWPHYADYFDINKMMQMASVSFRPIHHFIFGALIAYLSGMLEIKYLPWLREHLHDMMSPSNCWWLTPMSSLTGLMSSHLIL